MPTRSGNDFVAAPSPKKKKTTPVPRIQPEPRSPPAKTKPPSPTYTVGQTWPGHVVAACTCPKNIDGKLMPDPDCVICNKGTYWDKKAARRGAEPPKRL